MRVKMTDLAKRKPVPEQICTIECQRMNEQEFKNSGAWGFTMGMQIVKTDEEESMGRILFDNLPLLGGAERDQKGNITRQKHEAEPSGALFRFAICYEALTGNEFESDYAFDSDDNQWYDEDDNAVGLDEVKQAFRDMAQEMIGFDCLVQVGIEEGEGEYEGRDRNRIEKWRP